MNYWQQLDELVAQHKSANAPPKAVRMTKSEKQLLRTQIEPDEWLIVYKMQCAVTFPPGHSHKRFIRDLKVTSQISDRGRAYLAYIAHRYRRQWKPSAEEFAWIVQWGAWIEPNKSTGWTDSA